MYSWKILAALRKINFSHKFVRTVSPNFRNQKSLPLTCKLKRPRQLLSGFPTYWIRSGQIFTCKWTKPPRLRRHHVFFLVPGFTRCLEMGGSWVKSHCLIDEKPVIFLKLNWRWWQIFWEADPIQIFGFEDLNLWIASAFGFHCEDIHDPGVMHEVEKESVQVIGSW